jgi:aspartyl-tRNA(Asn)/glutamyl-tRNA(Gln) amidotransferase subunit C
MLASGVPGSLSKSDVEYIARLAHVELTDDERGLFARQLADILAYAEQIAAVDTDDVAPTAHVVEASLDRNEALAQAPDAAGDLGFFRVPRVLS